MVFGFFWVFIIIIILLIVEYRKILNVEEKFLFSKTSISLLNTVPKCLLTAAFSDKILA